MFEAGDVIDVARDLDAGFVRENHPDRLARRFLSAYQRTLAGKVVKLDRHAISAEITVSLPLDDFDAGEQLESEPGVGLQYFRIQDADAIANNGDAHELELVTPGRRFGRALRFPAAYFRATGTLQLVGRKNDWNAYSEIRIRYAPIPGDFTKNTGEGSESVLPDDALEPMAWKLGAFLGRRRPEVMVGALGAIEAEADELEDAFLFTVQQRKPSKGRVRDRT